MAIYSYSFCLIASSSLRTLILVRLSCSSLSLLLRSVSSWMRCSYHFFRTRFTALLKSRKPESPKRECRIFNVWFIYLRCVLVNSSSLYAPSMNSFFLGHLADISLILASTLLFLSLSTITSCLRIVYSRAPSIQLDNKRAALPNYSDTGFGKICSIKSPFITFIWDSDISGMESI